MDASRSDRTGRPISPLILGAVIAAIGVILTIGGGWLAILGDPLTTSLRASR